MDACWQGRPDHSEAAVLGAVKTEHSTHAIITAPAI
jgi:hypothetical protein